MDMTGSELIANSPIDVWSALNNPAILKQCIPGCTELLVTDEGGFTAKVTLKIGPVKANFSGSVMLSNINAPHSYTISGEGNGGIAGHAKGSADVALEAHDDGTMLHYTVKADVGGKIAQLGSRLIDATAKKLAGEFFKTFNQVVSA